MQIFWLMHKAKNVDALILRVFESYPSSVGDRLLVLRELIFHIAASTDGVGEIEETANGVSRPTSPQ